MDKITLPIELQNITAISINFAGLVSCGNTYSDPFIINAIDCGYEWTISFDLLALSDDLFRMKQTIPIAEMAISGKIITSQMLNAMNQIVCLHRPYQ